MDIITPFTCNEDIRRQYTASLDSGKRLAICLEGDVGTAKGQVLWRLQSQGYQTLALPFVAWLERERVSAEDLEHSSALFVECSERWQAELDSLIVEAVESPQQDTHRPGLLFVARSPLTSWRELNCRGLTSQRSPRVLDQVVTLGLHADSIQMARRVAEKTFNEPTSNASKLLVYLSKSSPSTLERLEVSVDSTSSKQCVANLLTVVGVAPPAFPPRFTSSKD